MLLRADKRLPVNPSPREMHQSNISYQRTCPWNSSYAPPPARSGCSPRVTQEIDKQISQDSQKLHDFNLLLAH